MGRLTQVVLLNVADVAVDGGVAKDDQHDCVATVQRDTVGRVSLHGVDLDLCQRADNGVPPLPRTVGYVEDPQLIGDVVQASLQFPPKHVDVILIRRGFRQNATLAQTNRKKLTIT